MSVQDTDGGVIDSWQVVSASEERLLLHQFVRFNETRAIAQHLILQQALQTLSITRPPLIPPGSRTVDCSSHQSQLGILAALQSFHNSNARRILSSCDWFLPRDERGRDAGTMEEDGNCGREMATCSSSELKRMETELVKDHQELDLPSNSESASSGSHHQGPSRHQGPR